MHRYLLNSFYNIKIGANNIISKSVKIHENVIIGNNNKIHDNVIIYPNTIIGDNNIILNNNIIGEYPVQASNDYRDYDFTKTFGTKIENNNFLHVRNIIFAGIKRHTFIGNNNKILSECHINHDTIINNYVTLYLRAMMAGFSECLNYSNIGGYGFIQQYKIIGQYTMIGGNQLVTKDVFPYFVFVNGKITRLNYIKLSDNIIKHENELKKLAEEFYKGNKNIDLRNLPDEIKNDLKLFLFTPLKI
jgi:acyl-[acyl carrier protein]--UDP-N-acetylglucosamine O-acyltransferase